MGLLTSERVQEIAKDRILVRTLTLDAKKHRVTDITLFVFDNKHGNLLELSGGIIEPPKQWDQGVDPMQWVITDDKRLDGRLELWLDYPLFMQSKEAVSVKKPWARGEGSEISVANPMVMIDLTRFRDKIIQEYFKRAHNLRAEPKIFIDRLNGFLVEQTRIMERAIKALSTMF